MSRVDTLLNQLQLEIKRDVPVVLEPNQTGLPFPIGIGQRPTLKVRDLEAGTESTIAYDNSIELVAGDLYPGFWVLLARYIESNQELLFQYWDGEISALQYSADQKSLDGIYKLVQDGSGDYWRMGKTL